MSVDEVIHFEGKGTWPIALKWNTEEIPLSKRSKILNMIIRQSRSSRTVDLKIISTCSSVNRFIRSSTKALVDVRYPNSLIEAHNKIIKYNYLYRMDLSDRENLVKALKQTVNDHST
jgi:hypothetical protein